MRKIKMLLPAILAVLLMSVPLTSEAGFNLGGILGGVVKSGGSSSKPSVQVTEKKWPRLIGSCDIDHAFIIMATPKGKLYYENGFIIKESNDIREDFANPANTDEAGNIRDMGIMSKFVKGIIYKPKVNHYFTFDRKMEGGPVTLIRHEGNVIGYKDRQI